MSEIRIGISGWRYAGWRGVFYPKGLVQRDELAFAAAHFGSIEINGSFYALQRPESYRAWYAETPASFVFAVKGGRFITHMKKLRDVETPLANFFASGVLCLEDKLGPILWQLPSNVSYDEARFEAFLGLLPRDGDAATRLARRHDARVVKHPETSISRLRRIRHAMEVRDPSCACPALVEQLRRHGVALVVADTGRRFPYLEDVTADFIYVRLHGGEKLYESAYSAEAIRWWAARVRAWSKGSEPPDAVHVSPIRPERIRSRDVYVYFDNDAKVHAPFDAMSLQAALQSTGFSRRTAS